MSAAQVVANKAVLSRLHDAVNSGDAEVIAPSLAHFGEVTVVDPEHEFQTVRTIPAEAAP